MIEGNENMFRNVRSGLSAAMKVLGDQPLALSQEKREYVLEDVFWVPISSRRSTSRLPSELHLGRTKTRELSRSNEPAIASASKRDWRDNAF